MAIDEKYIGEEFYTVLSNRLSGKIALVCKSVCFYEIKKVLKKTPTNDSTGQ